MNATALRILFVVPGVATGHSMVFARRQAESLTAQGFAVEVFDLRSRTSPRLLWSEFQRFRMLVGKFRPQVIHAHYGTVTAMFAARALGDAAREMERALHAGQLERARSGLRSLCSRDPSQLSEPELVGATIESVAENASDSFVAPLFYYVLLGLPGAVAYRAVNTLDAMVGYRGRYEYLGKASARLDDLLNFIPARLTALALLLAGALLGKNVRAGLSIWHRDARTTASPNAGRPMAAMAGLLGVRLEKAGHYALGDARISLTEPLIGDAWRVVRLTFALTALSALALAAR